MKGWEVVTSDGDKVGRVVAEIDDYLIVEQGYLIKSRHPLPKSFASALQGQEKVCASVPKDMIQDAPKVDGDEFDREATARYYGLAGGMPDAPAEGYGDSDPDDPAWGADQTAEAAGMMPGEQERAQIMMGKTRDRSPASPGLLGGRKKAAPPQGD